MAAAMGALMVVVPVHQASVAAAGGKGQAALLVASAVAALLGASVVAAMVATVCRL